MIDSRLARSLRRGAWTARRLAERPVKEALYPWFVGAASAAERADGPDGPPATTTVAVICQELFDRELGGFGGFGRTVRHLADHYNGRPSDLSVKVVMPHDLGLTKRPELRRVDHTDVLILPSLPRLVRHPVRYARELRSLRADVLIAIDYLTKYEYVLWAAPKTPLLVYIRDPRAVEEWDVIASVSLEPSANTRPSASALRTIAEQHEASFGRVHRWSALLGRKIVFATNAHFLVDRARRKLGVPIRSPYYLPNPLPMPSLPTIERAEKPTFLFLGRLEPVKRPWIVFELARRFPDVDFVIAGRTPFPELMAPIFERYANVPNLTWAGLVDGARKDRLLRQAWALINTSIHEGLPVSFLEAFSYGKCVLSGLDPDGLVSRFGYLAGTFLGEGLDEATLGAFSAKIRECLADEAGRLEKGRAARAYVEQMHTFASFDRHLRALLAAEGIGRPRRPAPGEKD